MADRDQPAAADALEDPEEYEAVKAPGRAAHERAEGEQGDRGDLVIFSADKLGKPPGHRDHDGVGNKVGGDGPGGLIVPGRQRAPDVVERHVYDRRVDDLDEGGEHHGECDEAEATCFVLHRHFVSTIFILSKCIEPSSPCNDFLTCSK